MPSHPAAVKQNKPFKPYSHCFKRGRCVEFALPDFGVLVGWPSGLRRTPGKCVYVNSVPRVQIPIPPPDHCFSRVPEVSKNPLSPRHCGLFCVWRSMEAVASSLLLRVKLKAFLRIQLLPKHYSGVASLIFLNCLHQFSYLFFSFL